MPLIWAAFIAAALQAKPPATGGDEVGLYLRGYAGDWAAPGFDFHATRIDGKRHLEGKDVTIAGVEAGIELGGRYFSFFGVERGEADGLELETFSIGAGADLELGERGEMKLRVSPYGAAMAGRFEVDDAAFGDFRPGFGVKAGVELGLPVAAGLSLGAFIEGRAMRYAYDEEVLSGESKISALGGAAGFSVDFRF